MQENNNIIDYINWRGDMSFNQNPLNCVDALIFSQLIHICFEYFLKDPHINSYSIKDIYRILLASPYYANIENKNSKNKDKEQEKEDHFLLLKLCAQSIRFCNVTFCDYLQVFNRENECQFAAGTFIITDKKATKMIAFRGTDSSLIGWKEDFNLLYLDCIPSQKLALDYVNNFSQKHKGKFYLTGHSKGALNAIYASMNISKKNQKRIINIFNFDGPGLKKDQIESHEFNNIQEKILSFYPSFCLVGQLFYKKKQYQVISSSAISFSQHEPYSWCVVRDSFVKELSFTKDSLALVEVLNSFINKLTLEERQKYIDAFFSVFFLAGINTFEEYEENKFKYSAKMISAYASLDSSCRAQIIQLITKFLPACKEQFPLLNFFK